MRFLLTLTLLMIVAAVAAEEKKPPVVTYDDHVRQIIQQKCASCHNPDKKSADLDLTNYTSLMQGGASGEVIEPGDASASYLYKLVTHEDEPSMPPESPKIPDEMIETFRKWIDGGVLENTGSTAKAAKKKKYDLALTAPSTARPAVVPMPGRLSLQPAWFAPQRTAIDALATSPWAPLAAVSSQKQVLLYNTQTLDLVGVLPFPEGTPRVLKFSRNGGLLLCGGGVGGASGRVVVWDIRSGQRIIEIGDELDEVLAADISSDQTLIALGGPQRVVRIYATETGQLLHEIRKHTDWITAIEFSPDSVLLATGDRSGGLYVWEGWTGREYLTLKGHTGGVTSVSWRSDSNLLASASEDSTIRLWEMENGGQVKSWGAHGGGTLSVEFTRDGRLLSCGRDRVTKTWDQNGAQQQAFEGFADLALRASYCDETNRAISGDWNGEIRVWNSGDGARVGMLAMNVPTLQMRLDEASRLLASEQSEHQPIADSYVAAQSELQKINQDLDAAAKRSAEAKQKADVAQSALAAAQAAVNQLAGEEQAAKNSAAALSASVAALKEAANKARAAAATLPQDAELNAAAETIGNKAEAKSDELKAALDTATQKLEMLKQAQQVLTDAVKLASNSATVLTAAQQDEQNVTALLVPAQEKISAAKQALDQSQAEVSAASDAVSHWTDEIEFDRQLSDLRQQHAAALDKLSADEEQRFALQAAAEEARKALEQMQVTLAEANQAVTTQNEVITQQQSAADQIGQSIRTLQGLQ